MPLEYEYRYFGLNKKDIIKKIRENGGKKKGVYLFKVMVMIHPLEKSDTYIRVRDEGYRITMTYKSTSKTQFQDEHEVIIDDFESGCNILFGIGCKKNIIMKKLEKYGMSIIVKSSLIQILEELILWKSRQKQKKIL